MPTELFNKPDQCNPIMPYEPVKNRLSFFRISLFEYEFDLLDVELPRPPKKSPYGVQGPGFYKLGMPISDLFPEILPEAPTGLVELNGQKFRVGSNGTFLPAKTVNRRFTGGTSVDIKERKGKTGFTVPSKYENLFKNFNLYDKNALLAGQTVTKISDLQILRFSIANKTQTSGGSLPKSMAEEKENPPLDPTNLSDEEYFEIMALLIDHKPSSRYVLYVLNESQEVIRDVLLNNYKDDPRSSQYFSQNDYLTSSVQGRSSSEFPAYEIGLLSRYEQEWSLTGYSRGSLTSAFTLAPNEEMVLEVFTWDRSKLEEQREATTEYERNTEMSSLTKVSAQISHDLSETTDRNARIGLGATLPVEGVPVKLDGNADVSNSIADSWQTSVDFVSEASYRASERYKTTNQVKVVQTRETGREERVTRRIKNPNLGRTLTMNCFEVVEHYNVSTRLSSTKPEFVLLVEFPRPKEFDVPFVLAYQDKLQRSLLSAVYAGGFEAAKKKLAQEFFDNRSLIKTEIESAQSKARAEQESASQPVSAIVVVAKSIKKIINSLKNLDLVREIKNLADSYRGEEISESERAKAHAALGRFNFWLKFKMVTPGVETKAIEFARISDNPNEEEVYEALSAFVTGLDDEWVTTVKMIAANLVSAQLAFTLVPVFPWLTPMLLEFAFIEDNMGLPGLIEKAKKEVRNYEMKSSVPPAAQGGNPDGNTPLPPPLAPPQLYTLAELAEADAEFRKLQLHLEANAVYYMNFIFAQEDPNVRYEKLKALGVHRVVENRLLGFIGRKAVFPLQFENLEPETYSFITTKLLAKWQDQNGELQLPDITPNTIKVALPTGGLYMEAVLGQCDALEPYTQERRLIDLQLRRSEVALAEARALEQMQEVERLKKRLKQEPPLLDSPYTTISPTLTGSQHDTDNGDDIDG